MPPRKVVGRYVHDGSALRLVTGGGTPGPDPQAPSTPTNLDAVPSQTSVLLTWNASTPDVGDGIDHYEVRRDGTLIASPGGTTYTATGLGSLLTYVFDVRAVADSGLVSDWATIQVQTLGADTVRVLASGPSDTPWQGLDARLASRVGTSTPLLAGSHTYSGSSFPATFGASTAKAAADYGCRFALLNVKCDWAQLASGALDSRITGFATSVPTGFTVYLLINHEPENDGRLSEAPTWRAGQARAANLIASLNDPRLEFGVCHMAYTWKPSSGRNPNDWNPAREGTMTQAALDRTIFAPDGYTDMQNAAGTQYQTMGSVFDAVWASASSWGFSRFAISEHTLNNDVGASGAACANWWSTQGLPYIRNRHLVYYALYNSRGPAAGQNALLDTPEEETVFGNFCVENRAA